MVTMAIGANGNILEIHDLNNSIILSSLIYKFIPGNSCQISNICMLYITDKRYMLCNILKITQ